MVNSQTYHTIKRLESLTIFRGILKDKFVINIIKAFEGETFKDKYYAKAMSYLMKKSNGDLGEHFKNLVKDDENFYIKKYSKGLEINEIEHDNFERDMFILDKFLTCFPIDTYIDADSEVIPLDIPNYAASKIDIKKFYSKVLENSRKNGYGMWANYNMFTLSPKGKIRPVKNPQTTDMKHLYEYESEKQIIYDNSKRLVEGKTAQNVLLTGDAGCGKSSSIKAIANEFKNDGLRIIEVKKNQIVAISRLLEKLSDLNLKFIIFIDDVSYSKGDENYNALKALLEGSLMERSHNIVIYATSNRRHMIAEKFSDRDGDDIHVNDVIQEQISLSDRFGIHITFSRPSKDTYLEIVKKLAHKHKVKSTPELLLEAEKFALTRGGRSARTALQFIEMQA